MTPRGLRLVLAAVALAATAGCGGDSEARVAVGQLAEALSEPDAAALRGLVGSESRSGRTDLLTDEVVADNAFAGHEIDVASDVDRFNGYGTFTLTSPEVPGTEVEVQQRLTETRAPAGLATVGVSGGAPLGTLLVNDHPVDVAGTPTDPGRPPMFYLPPGRWTFDLPPNPYADTEPQTVVLRDSRPPGSIALRSELNAAGRAEAVRRAEAYVTACGREQKDPESGCGGGLTLCVGDLTTSSVTFSSRPEWSLDASGDDLVVRQQGLRRTVTTTCTDRDTGEVTDRSTKVGPARLSGGVRVTADGLDVDLR